MVGVEDGLPGDWEPLQLWGQAASSFVACRFADLAGTAGPVPWRAISASVQ